MMTGKEVTAELKEWKEKPSNWDGDKEEERKQSVICFRHKRIDFSDKISTLKSRVYLFFLSTHVCVTPSDSWSSFSCSNASSSHGFIFIRYLEIDNWGRVSEKCLEIMKWWEDSESKERGGEKEWFTCKNKSSAWISNIRLEIHSSIE